MRTCLRYFNTNFKIKIEAYITSIILYNHSELLCPLFLGQSQLQSHPLLLLALLDVLPILVVVERGLAQLVNAVIPELDPSGNIREGPLEVLSTYGFLHTDKVKPQLEDLLAAQWLAYLILGLDPVIVEELVAMELTELDQLQLGSDGLALDASLHNRVNDLVAATITDEESLLKQDSCGEVDVWGLQEQVGRLPRSGLYEGCPDG